ncbi:hypothetical protein JCM1840_005403 [Sporobolomyces johnsonii]
MSAASFFIPSLPGQPADSQVTMYGGHIPSAPVKNGQPDTESDAHLYFFMVRNRHIAETERTLLWFNGGPGCSSFDGSMMEIGPFRLVRGGNGELTEVDGAWNEYANVIFIDQPVGTGYAYMATNSYVHELPEAAQHVVKFMEGFYKVFPEFQNHDTYIAGESYAGQYIPYIASAFLSSRLPVASRLKGLLIGNGWIDPWNQYPAYLDFALQAGVIKAGSDAEARVKKEVARCLENQEKFGKQNVKIHNGVCEGILGSITDSTVQAVNGQNMCVNNYDVRLTDTHPACGMNWPPDLADIHPYLSRDDVKSAFHATRHTGPWVECNGQVGAQFYTPTSRPSVALLPELLEKLPILMFAGAEDLICNHVGIERMIENLEWNGATGFGNVTADEWYVNGKNAGTWTTARNLTYVKILDASHMVPYDQPLAAHDMFLRFIGVSLLSAAGPAAQVPSRIGNEQEAVLGSTHPNGTALDSSAAAGAGAASGSGGSSPARLDELDSAALAGGGAGGGAGAGGGGGGGGAKALGGLGMGGTAFEGLVNASSALVLVLIMLGAFGTFLFVRKRIAGGARGRFLRAAGGEGWGSLGGGGGRGRGKGAGLGGQHARVESLGRGGGQGLGGVEGDSEEAEHELDELMVRRDEGGGGYTDDQPYDDAAEGRIGGGKGKGRARVRDEEEIFGLGDEDEDEADEDGGERKRRADELA